MPLHSTLTDPNLHEPKGISTATYGRTYVSNGSGSGEWKHVSQGWSYSQHSGPAQTVGTTDVKLLINGAGSLSNTTYLPTQIRGGVGDLWNVSTSRFTPIALGDSYIVRIDLPVTARSSAQELTVSLDIGTSSSPSAVILPKYIPVAKTAPFTTSVDFPLVVLTSTTFANGIQVFLKTDSGSIDITNPSITIIRISGGI